MLCMSVRGQESQTGYKPGMKWKHCRLRVHGPLTRTCWEVSLTGRFNSIVRAETALKTAYALLWTTHRHSEGSGQPPPTGAIVGNQGSWATLVGE